MGLHTFGLGEGQINTAVSVNTIILSLSHTLSIRHNLWIQVYLLLCLSAAKTEAVFTALEGMLVYELWGDLQLQPHLLICFVTGREKINILGNSWLVLGLYLALVDTKSQMETFREKERGDVGCKVGTAGNKRSWRHSPFLGFLFAATLLTVVLVFTT